MNERITRLSVEAECPICMDHVAVLISPNIGEHLAIL
jgi:hypothetical protein